MLPWLSKTEKLKRTSLQNIHLSKIAFQNPRRPQRGRAGGPLRLASQVVSEAVLETPKVFSESPEQECSSHSLSQKGLNDFEANLCNTSSPTGCAARCQANIN